LIRLFENDLTDDSGSESTSDCYSLPDAFQQAAASIGVNTFPDWGLDSENATMINGVCEYPMTVDHNGAIGAGSTTPPEIRVVGTAPSDYTFGGILGTQEINTRASIYRTGTRITVSRN
jgi:hypothetical protein